MEVDQILKDFRHWGSPSVLQRKQSHGIVIENSVGVSIPVIKTFAKKLEPNHALAMRLWKTQVVEVQILACLIAEPDKLTEEQMEAWVIDINSWDLCDMCCGNLFDKTPIAYQKAMEWSQRKEEYVKRAGFALMCALAVHDKKAPNEKLTPFFDCIEAQAGDERNFVKKAVNWALRQLGKRNLALNQLAIACGQRIRQQGTKSARWIASDALRELQNDKVQERLLRK